MSDDDTGAAEWFRVSTRQVEEREIDIDDRQARVMFDLEMVYAGEPALAVQDLHVVVVVACEPPNQNVAILTSIGGSADPTSQRLVVVDRTEGIVLCRGDKLTRELFVRTGAFSSPDLQSGPATPGLKHYDVEVQFAVKAPEEPVVSTGEMTLHIACD